MGHFAANLLNDARDVAAKDAWVALNEKARILHLLIDLIDRDGAVLDYNILRTWRIIWCFIDFETTSFTANPRSVILRGHDRSTNSDSVVSRLKIWSVSGMAFHPTL